MSNDAEQTPATEERLRVLVGVDGSEDGLRAVEFAGRTAQNIDGIVHIVHAVDDAILAGAWGVVYDPTILQQAGKSAIDEAVDLVVSEGLPADRVKAEVLMGNPSSVLSRLSDGADLLIVGRRSASGLERMFIGSTSSSVAATAKCPVITISKAVNPTATNKFGVIGVGVDPNPLTVHSVEWAFNDARRRGTDLRVIHITSEQPAGLLSLLKPTEEQKRTQVEASTARVEELLKPLMAAHPEVNVDVQISYGNPVDDLVKQSETLDMLILGVHHSTMPGQSLGGIVRGVLAHALCPVAVVR